MGYGARALALTMQEVAECRQSAELFELEMRGGVGAEAALFLYAIVVMHVLIEEWYVPALELVTSGEILDLPRPLLGCTIMAAGNCLPELSMALVALLWSGNQDIGWECSPLHALCAADEVRGIRLLLEFGADPERASQGSTGWRPLHVAARAGALEAARLLTTEAVDILGKDKAGKTAYDVAVAHGRQAVADLLGDLFWKF